MLERRPDAALQSLSRSDVEQLNYMPMVFPRRFYSGWAKRAAGDLEGARADLEAAAAELEARLEASPDDYTALPSLGLVYAMLGRSEEALAAGARAAELYGIDRDRFFGLNVEIHVAWIEAEVGEHEAAINRLIRLLALPNPYLSPARLRIDPIWDPLRDNPRFVDLTTG